MKITNSILDLERALPKILNPKTGGFDFNEDDTVVHQSSEGELKVGFAEETGQQRGNMQVWFRENLFDLIPSQSRKQLAR